MERQASNQTPINNQFYDELGEEWLYRKDHPIALLRSENNLRVPWIIREIDNHFSSPVTVLDIGCGGGLLTNPLSEQGHEVVGIDLSLSSLDIAKRYDNTKRVKYIYADACHLPFPDNHFDVVCAMDVIEHVEDQQKLFAEAARVLKKGGFFFFHTFNRNPLSYLLIIKGVDWFVPNAPSNMHVYPLFMKPKELSHLCNINQLKVIKWLGVTPNIFSKAMGKMLYHRKIPEDFSFCFSRSLIAGYCGIAIKK
ncbi:MAG: 3-demethylubiquinone-9 3-O-methyltransferase [Chlamydiales bacterium]|nr:3-demethylubiquinone-9 3-O-methyltransferase [Chlamydiales bacterium]